MQYEGRKALLRYCVEKGHVHGFISVVITQLQVLELRLEPIFLNSWLGGGCRFLETEGRYRFGCITCPGATQRTLLSYSRIIALDDRHHHRLLLPYLILALGRTWR